MDSDPPGPDPRLGSILADRYRVVRLIGQGGMGRVYEAQHVTVSRRFAVKVMEPAYAAHPDSLRRFENEAKLAGSLEHPNLVAVTDFGRAGDGLPYLVMEFLEGQDCGRLMRDLGALPVARAASIACQACRGLAVVHRAGAVHRDLKPENLFLTAAGDGSDLVKVLDFGIAKILPDEAPSLTGSAILGTCYYMAPEQAVRSHAVDARADIWSLGVVLYQMLSGQRPFAGESTVEVLTAILRADPPPLATLRPDLPAELVAVIERAMSKLPGGRQRDVTVLERELAPFARGQSDGPAIIPGPSTQLAGTPAAAHGTVASTRQAKAPPPRRWLALVLASVIAALGALVWSHGFSGPLVTTAPKTAPPPRPPPAAPAPPVNPARQAAAPAPALPPAGTAEKAVGKSDPPRKHDRPGPQGRGDRQKTPWIEVFPQRSDKPGAR